MEKEAWEPALEYFSEGLSRGPQHIGCLRDSAECYLRLGDGRSAEEAIGRAREIDAANPYVLQVHSQILERAGRWDEAYEVMTLARRQAPEEAAFAHRLGRIAEGRGDNERALEHYDEALALDENFWEARLTRASVLIDLREMGMARQEIGRLRGDVRGGSRHVLRGIETKFHLANEDLDAADRLARGLRGAAGFGMRARIAIKRGRKHEQDGYALLAKRAFDRAKRQAREGLNAFPENPELVRIKEELDAMSADDADTR